MLASIHPLGERARGNRWSWTVAWYVAGSVAAGSLVGAVLGTIGTPLVHVTTSHAHPTTVPVIAAVLGATAVVADAVGRHGRHSAPRAVPGWRRQVNEDWLERYRPWVYGSAFGFQLGLGVVTIVTTWTLYAYLAIGFLAGSPAGAVIGATFGLARALPVVATAWVRQPDQLRRFHRRLHAVAAPARHAGTVAVALAAVATVAAR